MSETVEEAAIKAIALDILEALRPHMASEPYTRERVLAALNGLAFTTTILLHGTGQDPDAQAFFDLAVRNQLANFTATGFGRALS